MFHKQLLHEDRYLLESLEKTYIKPLVKFIPKPIETYHLTLASLLWSVFVIFFSYLSKNSVMWLWAMSIVILLQFITDIFDGELGRVRKTGLVRWGYYMDHFLDFIFLSCLFYGYSIILPEYQVNIIISYMIIAGYMFHFILVFPITNQLNISLYSIGSSELRIVGIFMNTVIIFLGKGVLKPFLYITPILLLILLGFKVYETQKNIWQTDKKLKSSL